MRTVLRAAAVPVAACALLVGCAAPTAPANPAVRQLHEHAAVAGTVMIRAPYPVHAIDAAAGVAGHAGGTTIDVLQASGVTRGSTGHVVLRIAVDLQVGDGNDHAQGCFAYRFGGASSDQAPRQMHPCPAGRPIALPTAAPAPVGAAQRAALVTALRRLPGAERRDAAAVRQAVIAALGPRFFVRAGPIGAGVFVQVTSLDTCVSARTTAQAVTAGPLAHGTDCRGG